MGGGWRRWPTFICVWCNTSKWESCYLHCYHTVKKKLKKKKTNVSSVLPFKSTLTFSSFFVNHYRSTRVHLSDDATMNLTHEQSPRSNPGIRFVMVLCLENHIAALTSLNFCCAMFADTIKGMRSAINWILMLQNCLWFLLLNSISFQSKLKKIDQSKMYVYW